MPQWSVINANQLIPSDLVSAVKSTAGLTTAAIKALHDAINGLISIPSIPDILDVSAATASALVSALNSLVAGTKAHAILIPIAKTIPNQPPPKAPATISDLQTWLDIKLSPAGKTAEAYQTLISNTGGNAGFYRTFLESLFDTKDPNRPQYVNQSDAVTMTVIMAGAASYAAVSQVASLFDQLTKPQGPIGGAGARIIPVPQNVAARPVAAATGKRIAIQITWDAPPLIIRKPYFPGLSITVRRYAVIRMTEPSAPSARNVADLFPTGTLTEGMSSRGSTVVAIGSGLNSRFLDLEPPTDVSKPLYYCVAWEVDITEPSGTVTKTFDQISNVVKVHTASPPPAHTGSPPDWRAINAAVDVFPDLSTTIQRALAQIGSFVEGKPSPTARLTGALKTSTAMATRLATRADNLLLDINRLQASLSRPLPSLHAIQLTNGTGGNAFLAAELARRLGDQTDPNRPPFDNGEYVCGICIVAGAPRLADLESTVTLLKSLVSPATSSNPLLSVLTAIDTVVTQTEATVFGPGITPATNSSTSPPAPTPVISDSGTPVGTRDPRNPNQGDTNITHLSELC